MRRQPWLASEEAASQGEAVRAENTARIRYWSSAFGSASKASPAER